MARRVPTGMSPSDYYVHGDSLLEWTPPDVNWMAPSQQMYGNSLRIINPTYRLISDKSGLPSANVNPGGNPITGGTNLDLPDEGHTFVYPIYHWGNPYLGGVNTGEDPRYLPTNVSPDEPGWTDLVWPTYTTKSDLYPHFSELLDPFDLREDEEGSKLYRILVGRNQLPTTQIPQGVDWFNLR
jgi:hypothetical protein